MRSTPEALPVAGPSISEGPRRGERAELARPLRGLRSEGRLRPRPGARRHADHLETKLFGGDDRREAGASRADDHGAGELELGAHRGDLLDDGADVGVVRDEATARRAGDHVDGRRLRGAWGELVHEIDHLALVRHGDVDAGVRAFPYLLDELPKALLVGDVDRLVGVGRSSA